MAAVRRAEAVWEGDFLTGTGFISAGSSKAFSSLPVTWSSRTQEADGSTSPEELVAAAHAACYCMALSNGLGDSGTPPSRLEVSATVTFEQVHQGWKVTSSTLLVRGRVPGGDPVSFRQAAETAKDGCPISVALQGNVELNVEATLLE